MDHYGPTYVRCRDCLTRSHLNVWKAVSLSVDVKRGSDSFFTWLLCSFRHHFRTLCKTEMANVNQHTKDHSTRHLWNFPWLACLRIGFWCRFFLIWTLESRLILGSRNMSHCGTSSVYGHPDHCFVVLKHIQQSFLMQRLDVWSLLEIGGARDSHRSKRISPFYHGSELCFHGLKTIWSH